MITEYTDERVAFIAGQVTRGSDYRRIMTRVCAEEGQPQVVDTVFALVWAAADSVESTIAGQVVNTVMAAGEDTVQEARDAHLTDLQADSYLAQFGSFAAVGTDTIRWTSKETVEGNGKYFDVPYSVVETTAGSGTATETETQAGTQRTNLRFGVGVVHDETDPSGKRVTLPAASTDRFAGVAIHGHAYDNRNLPADEGIPIHDSFPGMMAGYCAVRIDSDVAAAIEPGMPIFLKYTADGFGPVGQFRHNNTNAFAVPGTFTGKIVGSGEGALAEVVLNAP